MKSPQTSSAGVAAATADPEGPAPAREGAMPSKGHVRRILKISVPVAVVLAEREMTIESVLQMSLGTIIEFNVPFDADLQLRVADQTIGRGRAVKVGENFGLRMTRLESVSDRVDALGGR